MNPEEIKTYSNIINGTLVNGWSTNRAFVHEEKYYISPSQSDKSWFQGFYGIYLALRYKILRDNILRLYYFISGTREMLNSTKGIFLRDNNKLTVDIYNKKQDDKLEASKDQILGLVCGLFFVYYYAQEDPIVSNNIKSIFKDLNDSLEKHFYMLYNENEKRYYDSAYYLIVHYYGISKAINYVLGKEEGEHLRDFICKIFSKISFEFLEYKRRLIDKDIHIGKISIFDIPILKDEEWYKEMLANDEFSVNLNFYEFAIGSTISQSEALRIMDVLDNEEVMKLKHLNLAALYIYIINKYKIEARNKDFYLKVLTRDDYFYLDNIPPNSLGKFGWGRELDDTVNGNIQRNFTLDFEDSWNNNSLKTDKTLNDLLIESNKSQIEIDCGIPLLERKMLKNYNI